MDMNEHLELIKDYLEEAADFADAYEGLLMQLEQAGTEPPPELLIQVLGLLHTFKGNSGMMGFAGLQKYAHRLEDLFKAAQSGEKVCDGAFTDFALQTASHVREALALVSEENPAGPDLAAGIREIDEFLEGRGREPESASPGNGAALKTGFNPFAARSNVLKVDFERLDQLLNLMGELVIHRTRLGRIEAEFRETLGEKGAMLDLSDASEQIGKITTELHEAIMRVRMVPIRHVFMRFPRLVRDLARERGKAIAVSFEGEETELDKTVIDEIGEPLLHLIRNSIDHGIETPEERRRAGKSAEGSILVRAYQESSHIIITIEDDGKGIDETKLRAKARDLISPDQLDHLTLADLIFLPGLSTADQVSEVSGRGLGMDVVRKSLAKISGIIEADTEPGLGSCFTIKLPLTLAIVSALMVSVGGEQYAIPLTAVVESLRVSEEQIHLVNGREITNIRGTVIPLARLNDVFNLASRECDLSHYCVIVQSSYGKMGLIVDHLLGQQEIVIKALDDENIGGAEGVAGATILGDGKVVLIVDVLEIMARLRNFDAGAVEPAGPREVLHA